MAESKLSILLVLALVTGGIASASASPPAAHRDFHPCVFTDRARIDTPCAAFTTAGLKVLTAIPASAFGRDNSPEDIGVLDDGSVMVRTDRDGLYRIVDRHIQMVWRPNPLCAIPARRFDLAGAFDDEMLLTEHHDRSDDTTAAVRANGSPAFQLPFSYASVAQDASGVVWLFKGGASDRTVYAYVPRTPTLTSLEIPEDISSIFRSPNGHVYATNLDGLYQLDSWPKPRARLIHGSIVPGGVIQAVGRDGSLWVATSDQVIHVRPNGTRHAMLLVEPQGRVIEMSPVRRIVTPMSLTMTRDGTVWIVSGIVRIDGNDRIEVMRPPPSESWNVKIGPHSSVWALVSDAGTGQSAGIVNFVPAAAGGTTAWPLRSPAPMPTPLRCPPPTPPPSPTPPLPPKSGAVSFVYVANAMSHDLWGYWTDKNGRLTPVRGSPLQPGDGPEHLTIDPAGRRLYVGTWYDGIFVYSIDAQSGTLHLVRGSPFAVGIGSTVVFDRSGRYAYAQNLNERGVPDGIKGYAVDGETGALRPLGWSLPLNRWRFGLTMNPQRDLAYIVTEPDVETFRISGSGAMTHPSTLALKGPGTNLLIDPAARWAYQRDGYTGTITIYGIDPRTGMLLPPTVPAVSAGSDAGALAFDPRARFFYVANMASAEKRSVVSEYRVDPKTGMLRRQPTSVFAGTGFGNAITITPDGTLLYITNSTSKSIAGFKIDRATGALRPVPGSPFNTGDTPDEIISCLRAGDRCLATRGSL